MKIYFPMTCNILTPGHIKCLKYLSSKGDLIVGLLSAEALKGYKKELQPFKDRKFILENLNFNMKVVKQNSLHPIKNLLKYKCSHMASGDGWEDEELDAIYSLGVKPINIKFRNEKNKQYSSTDIYAKSETK